MRIVLDANVIISAFASHGLCESVMEVCLIDHEIILSEDLLDEVLRNLQLKLKLPQSIANDIGKFLREHGEITIPTSLPEDACRDFDDIKILGLAVASNANYIITGDKDLLVLGRFQDIPILTPRSFSDILHSDEK